MSLNNYSIDSSTISLISKRYKKITKVVNEDFWNSNSEIAHSRYVGSYGRGTAIGTSDLDVLMELPLEEYEHFCSLNSNGPSRLLQAVKNSISDTYSRTDVKGDGQVVVVNFSDGMKFEILPAFKNVDIFGEWDGTYVYPDSHMGGNWLTTNPKAEQDAMKEKNAKDFSNGLLFATCKHIRYVRSEFFSSYHLSGILVDSFVYSAIGTWHFLREGEASYSGNQTYEEYLLSCYNLLSSSSVLFAPGSHMIVNCDELDILGKVLKKMV